VVETLFHFDGTRGELMLLAYLVGGLAVFGAAFLPGSGPLYRVICLILGTVMAVWAAKVYMFGGVVYVNAFVVVAPLVLLVRGAIGTVYSIATRPPARGHLRPHPAAARQFGGPASYQPHPPTAYAAVHGSYYAEPRPMPVPAAPFADRHGAHAAQPAGHIPRQAGPVVLDSLDPHAGRARHRAS
jgi:hypothetical protein